MGVKAIKKMGGTVIAQDEETSEFFSMPSAAIGTGQVDFILPVDEIPRGARRSRRERPSVPTEDVDPSFEGLLEYVRDNRGFDFTGYKRASLMRRVQKRMHEVGISSYDEYHDFLEVHPEEFTHLFNTILINVTSFFRDPERVGLARGAGDSRDRGAERRAQPHSRVVRRLCVGRGGVLRGNAPGRGVGDERIVDRVKIYATDVDEDALAEARAGNFSAKAVDAIPPSFARGTSSSPRTTPTRSGRTCGAPSSSEGTIS